jgi:hypothetical protein
MGQRWHGKDSRWGDRVRVNIPVRVSASALTGADGCMKNLSLSGALVKADVDLGLRALVQVSIKIPSPSQRTAAITACEYAPSVIKELLRPRAIPLQG